MNSEMGIKTLLSLRPFSAGLILRGYGEPAARLVPCPATTCGRRNQASRQRGIIRRGV